MNKDDNDSIGPDDKTTSNPENIRRDMEEMIKNKFGDGVQFFSMPGFGVKKSAEEIEREEMESSKPKNLI